MATAYTATTYPDQPVNLSWSVAGLFARPFSFPVPAAGFALNDTIKLCPIAFKDLSLMVMGFHIEIPQLDSNGTPTVTESLGDTNGASNAFQAIWATNVNGGRSASGCLLSSEMSFDGTTVLQTTRGAIPKQYTAAGIFSAQASTFVQIDFMLKITAAPATATTTGTIRGYLMMQTQNTTLGSF